MLIQGFGNRLVDVTISQRWGGASPKLLMQSQNFRSYCRCRGNSRRNEESTDRLSAVESQTSLPLPTPMSEHFTFLMNTINPATKVTKHLLPIHLLETTEMLIQTRI